MCTFDNFFVWATAKFTYFHNQKEEDDESYSNNNTKEYPVYPKYLTPTPAYVLLQLQAIEQCLCNDVYSEYPVVLIKKKNLSHSPEG